MRVRRFARAAAVITFGAGAPGAFAHHGIANFDLNKDVTAMETFIASGTDIIFLDAADSVAIEPTVKKAIAAGVTVVVWATGFRFDFEWIHLPVFNEDDGRPTHQRGVTTCPGMYFLGLEGLYKITSSFIMGVGEDAAYLAEHITSRHLR